MELFFEIRGGDFTQAGKASSKIKKVLKQLNLDSKTIKKVVVAVYEAEVNVVAHAWHGEVLAKIDDSGITIIIKDEGPGIEDIEQAMTIGYSKASKEVREIGFGAGMGLSNIKKNTDELEIKSTVGKGTTVTFRNNF